MFEIQKQKVGIENETEIVEKSTRKRLKQIEIIFKDMEETFDEDIDKFGIHLNNFIINARTVTWLMQKEFANYEYFPEWYDLKVNEIKLKGFDKFIKIRNAIEKKGNLKLNLSLVLWEVLI